jgi:hypothetical protein
MPLLSGNSCNIITLLPLGVSCGSVNASTPVSTNGVIALYVTGGTPPYNILWNNGLIGSPISNLLPGNYTATVTDYYNDFSATTTCSVGYDSFYLEKFENCENSGEFVYYLADLTNLFDVGKVYKLTTQNGCWVSSGKTFFTGQTYINQFPQTNFPPYSGCLECLPPPKPAPQYPQNLCYTVSTKFTREKTVSQQINFSSGQTINGFPSWTSVTPTYTIYYNPTQTRWLVSGATTVGVPSFNYPSIPPIGDWTVNGAPMYYVEVSSGTCVTPPLQIDHYKTNPSCDGVNDGIIVITANGGIPTYTYSINGTTYQSSSNFAGLGSGNYTIYVKDSLNNVTTQSLTLTPTSSVVNYNVNLSLTPAAVETNTTTNKTKIWYWRIEVSPTLPSNKTVSFNVNFAVSLSATSFSYSTGSASTTIQNNIVGTPINTSTFGSPTVSPIISSSSILTKCDGHYVSYSSYTATYSASITGSGFITGYTEQSITTPNSTRVCTTKGADRNVITLNNLTLNNPTCSNLNTFVAPLTIEITKEGVLLIA